MTQEFRVQLYPQLPIEPFASTLHPGAKTMSPSSGCPHEDATFVNSQLSSCYGFNSVRDDDHNRERDVID